MAKVNNHQKIIDGRVGGGGGALGEKLDNKVSQIPSEIAWPLSTLRCLKIKTINNN